jgi:hypothetical protein
MSIATVDSNSDGQMTSAHPSLLGAIIATDAFCPSLLSYHCSDTLVATDQLSMTTVTSGRPVAIIPNRSEIDLN